MCLLYYLRSLVYEVRKDRAEKKEKRGTLKSFWKGNDMVIFIRVKRSLQAKEATGGQEEAGVREEAEASGRRLLQRPGEKRQWPWLWDGEARLNLSLCFIHPFSMCLGAGSTPAAGRPQWTKPCEVPALLEKKQIQNKGGKCRAC